MAAFPEPITLSTVNGGVSGAGHTSGSSAGAAGAAGSASSSSAAAAAGAPAATAAVSLPSAVDSFAHFSGVQMNVVNIVATAYLDSKLDLMDLARKAKNSEYNPRRFTACILRIREPRATALVFNSGKVVVMGAKSEQDAEKAADRFTAIIRKTGAKVHMKEFKIHNVVGRADLKFRVDLNKLHTEHHKFCRYDPDVFPGLTYRMKVPDVVLLIFHSGNVVLTKSKTREDIKRAFDNIYPVLNMYRSK